MSDKKIKDNYSLKEMEFNLKGMKAIKPFIQGDKSKIGDIESIEAKFKLFQEIPDKFNEYFSELGWIAYETMNFDIMTQAVIAAEQGQIDNAEKLLIEYY